MTNLSPQAQAIVDAYENTTDKYDALAAVLYALVIQLKYDQSCWDEPVEHMVLDARDILKIVKELKNV